VYVVRGELDQAEQPLSRAAERLPFNSVVQDHYGDLLVQRGNRAGAIEAWERALEGDRQSIDPAVIARKIEDARRATP
jgi:predicted negative regulator of RcsB-dependent stress response